MFGIILQHTNLLWQRCWEPLLNSENSVTKCSEVLISKFIFQIPCTIFNVFFSLVIKVDLIFLWFGFQRFCQRNSKRRRKKEMSINIKGIYYCVYQRFSHAELAFDGFRLEQIFFAQSPAKKYYFFWVWSKVT
jgi:hypothetical protein